MSKPNSPIAASAFPTFARILRYDSSFRCVLRAVRKWLLCGAVSFASMCLLTFLASILYLYVWRTFEFVMSSQSLVLPFCLLVSSFVGGAVARRAGLSHVKACIATLIGLAAFYSVGQADWLGWIVPEQLLGLCDGWFYHWFAIEDVNQAVYGDNVRGTVAIWLSLGLWTAVGLAAGMLLRVQGRVSTARFAGHIAVVIVTAGVLFTSVFYPLVVTEKREMDYSSKRITELSRAYSKLKQTGKSALSDRQIGH